ncbi:MAG: hypothetical protein M0Z47_10445 [Actinomycetota bacterium]|nr:hypothetical protein [Actinomycetota bacterium]
MTLIAALSLAAAVFSAVAAVAAYAATRRTKRLIRYLELAVAELRDKAIPLVGDARATLADAGTELDKLERLIDSTEAAASMMGRTSRFALAAMTSPLVRVKALSAGSRRAVSVFRTSRKGEA